MGKLIERLARRRVVNAHCKHCADYGHGCAGMLEEEVKGKMDCYTSDLHE